MFLTQAVWFQSSHCQLFAEQWDRGHGMVGCAHGCFVGMGWSDYKADLFQSLVITAQWGLGAVQPQCSHFPSFSVSQITEMFLYSFGRAWNENHIDFYSPFFYFPLICWKGDSDTVVAEGDLAAMGSVSALPANEWGCKGVWDRQSPHCQLLYCDSQYTSTPPLLHTFWGFRTSALLFSRFLLIYIFFVFIYLFGCTIS